MEIESTVREIVAEQLGVEPAGVTEKASFIEDLDADSLAIVELVLAFEERFGIEIPESETEKIRTVGDVITYIQANSQPS